MEIQLNDAPPDVQLTLDGKPTSVGRVGLGTMAVAGSYGAVESGGAREVLGLALSTDGCLVDTADVYGDGSIEQQLGALDPETCSGVVATKVGLIRDPSSPYGVDIVGRPDYLRAAVLRSAERLRIEKVPLVLLHRVDHRVPVEESVGALAELVQEGRVGGIGLSEASAESIRRANATYPLTAVQSEYSLWSRDIETAGVLDVLRELDIPLIASSPLGKGFLADGLEWPPPTNTKDSRTKLPRFATSAFEQNLRLLPALDAVAQRVGASRAQTALAWVLSRWHRTVVIPATRRPERFLENRASRNVRLSPADADVLEQVFTPELVYGDRYADMTFVNR